MKKKILIVLISIIGVIVLVFCSIVGFRYLKYRNLIGKYELIEGTYPLSPLKLNLYNWSEGNKKDLKCDLWNCSGYDEGNIYYIKGDIIIFKLSVGTISYKYKLEKRNNETYLILSSNNKRETKYKKVK